MAISDYLNSLTDDRDNLVTNLTTKGITGLSGDETFTELVPEVLNIPSGSNFDWEADNSILTISASNPQGRYIWSDGTNVYYSNGSSTQWYVFNKSTSTWSTKTWNGLQNLLGSCIWTDGTNIYYSNGSPIQYVLSNKSTSTWTTKGWNKSNFYGNDVWTDGTNIYHSYRANQYVLENSSWSNKTWTGLTRFDGEKIWTDGTDIYYSDGSNQYVLDISTSTWTTKTWNGLTDFNGQMIWSDGIDIYYSSRFEQYVLNKNTSTWEEKIWTGWSTPDGAYMGTDGTNIHCWLNNCYSIYKKVEGNIPKISTSCRPVMSAPTT